MVVVPALTPVTAPVLPTVAIAVLLLLHTPPVVASLNVVVAPEHTDFVPVTVPADGMEPKVTVAVADAVPQLLVTE